MLITDDALQPCLHCGDLPQRAPALRMPMRLEPPPSAPGVDLYRTMLDEIDVGILLAGPDGAVTLANRAARRACQDPSPLRMDTGTLCTSHSGDQAMLTRALLTACQGRRTMLNFRQSEGRLSVGVLPVTDHRTGLRVAMLVLGSRMHRSALNLQFFCQTHRLTLAESAVLGALVQGMTPRQAAEQGGVTVATVRSQITAIREKTHAASLSHLLRMVASLPPLAAAGAQDC